MRLNGSEATLLLVIALLLVFWGATLMIHNNTNGSIITILGFVVAGLMFGAEKE